MNRKLKTVIIVAGMICIAAAGFAVLKIHEKNAENRRQQIAAEEAAKKKQLEEKKKLEEEKKRREELGRWNLLLVNEWNAIPDDFEVETAEAENGYLVDARIKDDLEAMLEDCREAGFSPKIISSFRTRETQQYLYDHTANKSDTAIPGHSEHECGLAVDIIDASSAGWSDPLIEKQQDLPAQQWLMQHCREYGFILRYPSDKEEITGIIYEPWHYRYVGKKHADAITEKGLCLEEYIEQYPQMEADG